MRKENATGEQVIFTILTILAALLLLGLVAALSCSLSCSGAEGAAALVAILGVGLVVFLTIIALKAIFKEKSPKKVIY